MTGDESSPVEPIHPRHHTMHFRPPPIEDHQGGEDSPELHPSVAPPEGDSSPTAVRLGSRRFKNYAYATSGGAFGDPLGGDPAYADHINERRYRNPSGENPGDIDYIRAQYSPPPGEWGGNMGPGSHQVPYLEHSPRGCGGGGLLLSWEQGPKFNPGVGGPRWSEDVPQPAHQLHNSHHHLVGPPSLPPCGPPRRGPPRHHVPGVLGPESSAAANAPPHSGGSTTTSTSSLNDSIPDDTLAVLSVKELNKRVQNLNREDVVALKQRRRTLKNRGYAMNCRMRRQQHKESLEVQVDALKKDNLQLQNELDFYKNQLKNCRCHSGGGAESSHELPPSGGGGPPGSYPHHHHHHPLVTVHPQQLDLSVNPGTNHEDYKRIYTPAPHELKVQPNMNGEDFKKNLELSNNYPGMGVSNGRDHMDTSSSTSNKIHSSHENQAHKM